MIQKNLAEDEVVRGVACIVVHMKNTTTKEHTMSAKMTNKELVAAAKKLDRLTEEVDELAMKLYAHGDSLPLGHSNGRFRKVLHSLAETTSSLTKEVAYTQSYIRGSLVRSRKA